MDLLISIQGWQQLHVHSTDSRPLALLNGWWKTGDIRMTPDRSIANGIMEGMNCLVDIASALNAESSSATNDSWAESLQAMEQAFAAVQAGGVVTSIVIGNEQIERIRRIREMVSNWLNASHPPNDLKGQVDDALAFFGLPIGSDEEVAPHDLP
jgi:hypothetical protein